MIVLEVLNSNNNDQLGEYHFYKNLIYIGSSPSCDLFFEDKEIYSNHFFLEIIENKLLIHPHKEVKSFLIDGKKTTSMRYLKVNQVVRFSDIEFKIINYMNTQIEDLRSLLNTKTDELIKNNPDTLELISQIEELSNHDDNEL